jgi:hypothetical protein
MANTTSIDTGNGYGRDQVAAGAQPGLRMVTLFYTGGGQGASGWAYNAIDVQDEHTSDALDVTDADDGSEAADAVIAAFEAVWPWAAHQVTRWVSLPEGGLRGQVE